MKCLRSISLAPFDAKSSSPAFNLRRSRRVGDRSDAGVGVGAVPLRPQAGQLCSPASFRHAVSLLECWPLWKGFWREHQHAAGSTALGKPSALSVPADLPGLPLRSLRSRASVHSGSPPEPVPALIFGRCLSNRSPAYLGVDVQPSCSRKPNMPTAESSRPWTQAYSLKG